MKKIALVLIAAGLVFASCKKEDTTEEPNTFPTSSLKVDSVQRVLVQETTGAWCQFCPNGAEQMIALRAFYGDAIVPIAVHTGDALTLPIVGVWETNFPAAGVPNFYVMSEDAGQSPNNFIPAYLYNAPVMGVVHDVATTDTSYNVYAKVEVFQDSYNEDYLIMSYLILDGVLAKDYGNGIDLQQVSTVATVQTGSGSTPSKWVQDAAFVNGEPQIKAGDDYYHSDVLYTPANTVNPWGMPLADVNPFGKDFLTGDILGTRNTPILLSIPKNTLAPFETEVSVATMIWRLRTDGSGAYDFVNGYMSHVGHSNNL